MRTPHGRLVISVNRLRTELGYALMQGVEEHEYSRKVGSGVPSLTRNAKHWFGRSSIED